jgi:hypothetical protein
MGWLFGKKVVCFQCDRKVKEKDTRFRRGFRFCSDQCVANFLAENVLAPREAGTPESYTQAALHELQYALVELTNILKVSGGQVFSAENLLSPDVLRVSAALSSMEETKDAFARYNAHVTQALPYLYAVNRTTDADLLETIDLEELYDLSALGSGPLQQRKVRNLVQPAYEQVARIVQSFGPSA